MTHGRTLRVGSAMAEAVLSTDQLLMVMTTSMLVLHTSVMAQLLLCLLCHQFLQYAQEGDDIVAAQQANHLRWTGFHPPNKGEVAVRFRTDR
jgi:hypothetical protein